MISEQMLALIRAYSLVCYAVQVGIAVSLEFDSGQAMELTVGDYHVRRFVQDDSDEHRWALIREVNDEDRELGFTLVNRIHFHENIIFSDVSVLRVLHELKRVLSIR